MILEIIKELKNNYMNKFGHISYDSSDGCCISRWVEELNDEKYIDIFKNVSLKQKGDYVIIKYLDFEVIFSRDSSVSYSKFWNMYGGVYRECRGIVIDVVNEVVVLKPYTKFFNINEVPDTQENIIKQKLNRAKKVEFSNKLDGSLVSARYYNGEFFVASSGMLEDSIIVKFANKVIKGDVNYQNLLKDFADYTLIFESINIDDLKVVVYTPDQFGLYLTGIRNMKTDELLSYKEVISIAKQYGVRSTEQYLVNFSEIMAMKKDYKSSEKEGFVMNLDGELVKIKCDDYLLFSKMAKNNCSPNSIVKALYFGRLDDLMASVDASFIPVINNVVDTIHKYCFIMNKVTLELMEKAPKERPEFFKWLKSQPKELSRYLSSIYLGRSFSFLAIVESNESTKFVKFSDMQKVIDNYK